LGLVILGADAAPAIPQLARLATEVPSNPCTYWAITALGDIGPKAFPTLLNIAEDPKIPWRRAAVREIGKLGTNALPALPTIIRFLDDPDPQAAYDAAIALGDLSLNPQLSVPALTRCLLQHPSPLPRVGAAKSIVRFGPDAQKAIPEIQKAESSETDPSTKQFLQRILRDLQRKPENPTAQ
jgi:HEAT repeat protein